MTTKDGHPEPHYSLQGHCSIVHENTLYAYSSAGFQSLKLEEGAKWEKLPMDISLTGAQCVKTEDKLFIVGGSVNETASTWNYPGLMHYTFKNKKWDWQRSESWNTQNRQNHGAVYLPDSNKILVYSGSRVTGDLSPSPETFLISTKEPYSVQSFPSAGAPPSVKPLLLPWDSSSALMIGGGPTNTAAWTFSEAKGWQNIGVTLEQGIVNQESVQCTVASGSDGSKVLLKFDMGVSPNKVDRIVLLGKDGVVANPGTTVGDKAKRATIADWPAYNGTYAPKVTRSGFSLAQGEDGTTVASGGNDIDPLCIYDAQKNSWVNATELFNGQQVLATSVSSSSVSISSTTPTMTPSASSTPTGAAVAAGPPNDKSRMLTVLGATLGTIFGIAAILIFILFCLKYRKKKSKQQPQQPAGYVEKDRMSFADRGAEFMKEAGGSVISYNHSGANDSTTSLAIIQGRGTGHKKNMASDASTAGLVKKPSPLGYSDPVELSKLDMKPENTNENMVRQNSSRNPPAGKGNDRSRSSGWSRYFANNEATNLANMPSDRSTFASDRTSMLSQSQYTTSRMQSNHPSTHVPPLEIPVTRFDGNRISRVASGSPTLGSVQSSTVPHQPMQAELGRANSNGSVRSGLSYNDERYFRKPVESWTPVGDERPPSSAYTGSMIMDPNYKYDGTSSYYPDGTDSFYPKSGLSSFYPSQGKDSLYVPDARDSTFTTFPTGKVNSAQPEEVPQSKFSSMYPTPPRLGLPQDRESTVTVFPGGHQSQSAQIEHMPSPKVGSFFAGPPRIGHESTATMFPGGPGDAQDPKNGQADNMSWLNLGASR